MYDCSKSCCFSGYRPEKFDLSAMPLAELRTMLQSELEQAIRCAARDGYRMFISGMSRGFDLWAAETVLRLRNELSIQLMCALPFDRQDEGWPGEWKDLHRQVMLEADLVHSLSHEYTPDCFFVRNRFMVEGSGRLICWYDGHSGGTQFTVQCAKRRGLEVVNLADRQCSLF